MNKNGDNRILNLMIAHHALIDVLLTVVQSNLSVDKEKALDAFKNFQWQVKKHFFVEENTVFNFIKPEFSEIYFVVRELKDEHLKMLGILSEMEKNLDEGTAIDISEFRKILEDHRNSEEKVLYPWMDKTLDEIVKKVIIGRINEITLK